MDLYKAIKALHEEKKRLDRLIASLEKMQERGIVNTAQAKVRSRRGRRSMSSDERLEVSARMKRYWAARRAERQQAEATAEPPPQASAAVASTSGVNADPIF